MNETVRFELQPDGRRLDWYDGSGRLPLHLGLVIEASDCGALVANAVPRIVESWEPFEGSWRGRAGTCLATVNLTPAEGGVRVRIRLESLTTSTALVVRRVELDVGGLHRQSGTVDAVGLRIAYCGAFSRSDASRSTAITLGERDACSSWWVGAVCAPNGASIVLGAEEALRFATEVRVQSDGLVARQHLEGRAVEPGARLDLEALWMSCSSLPPHELLECFADRMGRAHGVVTAASPCGWGSWGHWLERIDLSLMRETVLSLDGLESIRNVVRTVQIDDGWSEMLDSGRVSASWQPNRRFPSGIAPLAEEIQRTGRECGLWLLPFTVNSGSALLAQHPEWLVAGADGTPMRVGGGDSYSLDPTHPVAAAWLRDLFQRLRDWNVTYVKLDFLRALMCPDPDNPIDDFDVERRYHSNCTRVEAYRVGLSLIRDVLGAETTIVACSAPAAPGAGLVSSHRVGPDIAPDWAGTVSGVRDAARALIANWFWQGRTWVNDPDYLMLCENESVTRFWVTVVAMSGGSVILSADLASLSAWEVKYLAIATPPIGRAARPVDLFRNAPDPRLLHLPFERPGERWSMLAVLNWDDFPVRETVDLGELGLCDAVHVWDVWREAHRLVRGELRVFVELHDVALLRLTPVRSHPQVVGTSAHWAQGWLELEPPIWDGAAGTLTVRAAVAAPRRSLVWVWYPPGWSPADSSDGAAELISFELSPGEVRVVQFAAGTAPGAATPFAFSAG